MWHRRVLAILLLTLLLFTTGLTSARAGGSIQNIYINGNPYPGVYGVMAGDHAMLQVRTVMEALGYPFAVFWSPEDGSTTIHGLPESPILIRPGDRVIRTKERSITLPAAPVLHENRLMAPLEFFRQAVGARVEWVSATHEVEITPAPYNRVESFGPEGAGSATFSALGKDGEGRLYLTVADGPRQGVWRSADHGATWTQLEQGIPVGELEAAGPQRPYTPFDAIQVVTSPDDPRWVWALTKFGVQVSQDGGETWQLSEFGTATAAPVRWWESRLLPGGGSEIFLLTGDQGVQYSPTGGGQWFRLTGYWPDARVLDAVMDGGRLFLATTAGGVIVPQRAPQPNARQLPRLAPRPVEWGPNLVGGAYGATSLTLDPQDEETAYATITGSGESRLYRTTDGGKRWEPLALPFEGSGLFAHHPTESGHYAVRGPDGISITRDDGQTWRILPVQTDRWTYLANLLWLPSGRLLVTFDSRGGSSMNYSDDLQSLKWIEGAPGWHITSLVANPAVPGTVYACDWSEEPCAVSHDDGLTWQPLASQPPVERPISLIWSPAAPDELIAGRFVSRDGGKSWEELPFFQLNDKILQIAVDPSNPQRRAAVAGTDVAAQQVWVSRDGGQNWHSIGRPPESRWIHLLRFDRTGRLWVGTDAGIWRIGEF